MSLNSNVETLRFLHGDKQYNSYASRIGGGIDAHNKGKSKFKTAKFEIDNESRPPSKKNKKTVRMLGGVEVQMDALQMKAARGY